MALAHAIGETDQAPKAIRDMTSAIFPWLDKAKEDEKAAMKNLMKSEQDKAYLIQKKG